MSNHTTFDTYRFQIVPTSNAVQLRVDNPDITYEQLKEKKNLVLSQTLLNEKLKFKGKQSTLVHKLEAHETQEGEVFLFHVGVERKDEIEQEDFSKREISRYPDFWILINNDPQEQYVLVQRNYKAFSDTSTVINILDENLNKHLKNEQLAIYFRPIFDEKDFWGLIHQYHGRLQKLKFDFIKPNMSNISGRLSEDLRRYQDATNGHKASLEVEAPKNGTLEVDPETEMIEGLVNYSAQGGGDISIKVKGVKGKIHTSKSTKNIKIDELSIEGKDPLTILRLLDGLL